MTIEQIEEVIANLFQAVGEDRARSEDAPLVAAFIQCQLLLHIYHRLDHVDDMVIAIEKVVNP